MIRKSSENHILLEHIEPEQKILIPLEEYKALLTINGRYQEIMENRETRMKEKK